MFEDVFSNLSRDESIEVAYYIARLLAYRQVLATKTADSIIRKGLSNRESESVRNAISSILDRIKSKAGSDIKDLDDTSVKIFLNEIAELVNTRTQEELPYESLDGKQLLRQLRESAI
ncbi:MAG TPA: hypothetical protein VI636_17990 [Candidatus Angelobacter sp.]